MNVSTDIQPSTIDWSPIIAGSVLACAISAILLHFGEALGLSFTITTWRNDEAVTTGSIVALGLWFVWTQLSSSMAGGYLAGRMLGGWHADHESEIRDGAHGLLVWALSTLFTVVAMGIAAGFAGLAVKHGVEPDIQISHALAKRLTIITGFGLAATSLISATAAYIMATIGGDHRDRKVGVVQRASFRRRAAVRPVRQPQ